MPKIWLLSDLHLEAVPYPDAFRPATPDFDVLLVAGDVWEGNIEGAFDVVRRLAGGKPVVFVLGNHELWGQEIEEARVRAAGLAEARGVILLDDSEAVVAGVRFLGGTLWADGALAGPCGTPEKPTGEHILISSGGDLRLITGADEAARHRRTLRFIGDAIARDRSMPTVVATHHAPHPSCLPEALHMTWAAGNTASDLSHLTDGGHIGLWVHGHIHATTELIRPHGTRIVCNAAGPGFVNLAFRDDWVIEV